MNTDELLEHKISMIENHLFFSTALIVFKAEIEKLDFIRYKAFNLIILDEIEAAVQIAGNIIDELFELYLTTLTQEQIDLLRSLRTNIEAILTLIEKERASL